MVGEERGDTGIEESGRWRALQAKYMRFSVARMTNAGDGLAVRESRPVGRKHHIAPTSMARRRCD